MNPLIITCFNNLEMTKKAVSSALYQDIPDLSVTVIDNGSTDGTYEWLKSAPPGLHNVVHYDQNVAPTRLANDTLFRLFEMQGQDWALVMPNDAILPRNMYREMLKWPRGIVTASQYSDESIEMPTVEKAEAVSECTPMAVMLIRRWAWQAVMDKDGYFLDEGLFHYASDCCLALRVAACGIRGIQLNIPYFHYGSASWRTLDPEQQRAAQLQADKDREYFQKKWGFAVNDLEYGQRAQDLNFKGVSS